MKVKQFYNKNQFVIYGNGEVIFQSYDSTIAKINNATDEITFYERWDYSKTTMKHLYLFIKEYHHKTHQAIKESKNKRATLQKLIKEA